MNDTKVVHFCPLCFAVRRVKKYDGGFTINTPRVDPDIKITQINPNTCQNELCRSFQRIRVKAHGLLDMSYQNWKKEAGVVEESKIKFLKLSEK